MIEQQSQRWQFVPPIITGGHIPAIQGKEVSPTKEWQFVPPPITEDPIPAIQGEHIAYRGTSLRWTADMGWHEQRSGPSSSPRENELLPWPDSPVKPEINNGIEHNFNVISRSPFDGGRSGRGLMENRVLEKPGTSVFKTVRAIFPSL